MASVTPSTLLLSTEYIFLHPFDTRQCGGLPGGREFPHLHRTGGVPVPTGSTTILVAVVKGKDVTKEAINAAMKAAASESFGYNEDQIVSSDVIGMRYGSLFDATQTMVAKIDDDTYQVQVVSWYDNENSYTSQMVRTIKYFAENC